MEEESREKGRIEICFIGPSRYKEKQVMKILADMGYTFVEATTWEYRDVLIFIEEG